MYCTIGEMQEYQASKASSCPSNYLWNWKQQLCSKQSSSFLLRPPSLKPELCIENFLTDSTPHNFHLQHHSQSFLAQCKYADGGDSHEMAAKRQRLVDSGSSFYGTSPISSFMYNPPPYGYVGQPPPFPVVRLRGLPFDCTETDVAEFFHGLDIVDVLFVHKGGKFTGEAFCVLGYPLQVDFALQRNRQNMGRRYVEVFRSKRQEYYKAIANEVTDAHGGSPRRSTSRAKSYDEGKDSADHTGVLRLRGLPFSANKDDILEFFKDFVLSEDSIHIAMNSEGRPSGEAYVEFASVDDSKAAMAKDRMTLGSRYIELFPSSHSEVDEAMSRGR